MPDAQAPDLPLQVISRDRDQPAAGIGKLRFRRVYLLVVLIPVLMFSGAVLGLYFQPAGVQKFYALTGLQPGGGSSSPIALPPEIELPRDMIETMQPTDVVGLARLMPRGDISIVAAPYGAGDARITGILVKVGDRVEKGAVLAQLDNKEELESAVLIAESNVAVREAALIQTRAAVQNSQDEARAAADQARSAAVEAASTLARTMELFKRGVTTQAVLDASIAADQQARLAVQKAEATLARYTSEDMATQADIIVATRNLEAAEADLTRARRDLTRAAVLAPISGTVLDINVRPGERPPADGIMQMGDTDHMMAEVEIYQDRIARVRVGQPVELAAAAIGQTLQGRVQSIGLMVGRQGLVADDTAANTDARVIDVMVTLDDTSSDIAARYTNLEVIARIDTRAQAQE